MIAQISYDGKQHMLNLNCSIEFGENYSYTKSTKAKTSNYIYDCSRIKGFFNCIFFLIFYLVYLSCVICPSAMIHCSL